MLSSHMYLIVTVFDSRYRTFPSAQEELWDSTVTELETALVGVGEQESLFLSTVLFAGLSQIDMRQINKRK